ncbi:hypothetical protein NOR_06689 [Metarhizium rileyi]|uniref:Uncharacterized protein n=1 Tax=Metarhizium rileyi (strain RCEF 4871) TaxID=1649241 RepID=A0A166ZW28_METRR|nr:hypothetical protein NOR_06689 [Metarhizium rileyi RCEF 4871]
MDQISKAITELRREMRLEMREMGERIELEMREMNQRIDEMGQRIDGLSQTMVITDKNVKARLANSIVTADMTLSPLYNVTTGQEVSQCPATVRDLEQCSVNVTTAILRELGENVPRAHEQRRTQLRLAFGIRSQLTLGM